LEEIKVWSQEVMEAGSSGFVPLAKVVLRLFLFCLRKVRAYLDMKKFNGNAVTQSSSIFDF
jgi:hypothetical protein